MDARCEGSPFAVFDPYTVTSFAPSAAPAPRANAGIVPKNASSAMGMTARTGCSIEWLENRASADAIVSIRSSIVRTAFTSASLSRWNMGMALLRVLVAAS